MNEKQFITEWIRTLENESIKLFPKDFHIDGETTEISLPGKGLLIGKEFFGEYEILGIDGVEILRVENYEKAKFIIYSNRSRPIKLSIPADNQIIKAMNSKYERYLDSIVKRIETNFRKEFISSKTFNNVLTEIYKRLNLIRL